MRRCRTCVIRSCRLGETDTHPLLHAARFFDDLFSNPAYQPYDLSAEQVLMGEELRLNRDPFDALVCAAARDLELPLITRDGDIRSSGLLRIVW